MTMLQDNPRSKWMRMLLNTALRANEVYARYLEDLEEREEELNRRRHSQLEEESKRVLKIVLQQEELARKKDEVKKRLDEEQRLKRREEERKRLEQRKKQNELFLKQQLELIDVKANKNIKVSKKDNNVQKADPSDIGANVFNILKDAIAEREAKAAVPDMLYTEQDQIKAAKEYKDILLKKYDNLLQELYNQKDQLTQKLLSDKYAVATPGGSTYYKLLNEQLDKQIKNIKAERDRYIINFENYVDPIKRSQNMLANTVMDSDYGSKLQLNKANTRDTVDKFDSSITDLKIPFTDKTFFRSISPNATKNYQQSIAKFLDADRNLEEYSNNVDKLLKYINSLGYLPRFNEIPDLYKDVAKQAFTKDGKMLLDDENYRNQYGQNSVIMKDGMDMLSNAAAKNAKAKNANLTEEFIDEKIKQVLMLKDYRQMNATPTEKVNVFTGYQDNRLLDDIESYNTSERLLKQAKKHLELNNEILTNALNKNTSAITNSVVAWREWLSGIVNDPLRYENLLNSSAIYKASTKLNNGENLTDKEKLVLQSKFLEDAYHGQYGDYEQSRAYKWNNIAAESLEFMMLFIATNGVLTSMQKGVVKGITKGLEKIALDQIAKRGVAGTIRETALIAGRLGIDAVYAAGLTNTLGFNRVLTDAYTDAAGNVIGNIDQNGYVNIEGIQNAKNFAHALKRSEIRNWIENYSEMMGEWGIGKGLYKIAKRTPKVGSLLNNLEDGIRRNFTSETQLMVENYLKNGILALNGIFKNAGLGRFIPSMHQVFNKNVLKAGQFHGFFGEVAEEYYGLVLQHIFGVQDNPKNSLTDDFEEQSADIWGGIAVSTGLLGGLGMIGSVRSLMKYNRAEQNLLNLFGNDVANEIRRQLLFADNDDISKTFLLLSQRYGTDRERSIKEKLLGVDPNKQLALLEYFNALLDLRGAVYGEDLIKKQIGEENLRLQSEAIQNGYALGNYKMLNIANKAVQILQKDADDALYNYFTQNSQNSSPEALLEVKSADDILDEQGSIHGAVQYLMQNISDHETISSVIAYYNSKNFKKGVDLRLNDLIEERALKAQNMILRLANISASSDLERKAVRLQKPVLNEDGSESDDKTILYLIDSHTNSNRLFTNSDGTVDIDNSNNGKKVLVSDRYGNYRYVDLKELEGYSFIDEDLDLNALAFLAYNHYVNQDKVERRRYINSLSNNVQIGEQMQIGDKTLTILDANPVNGITYSLSDKDGNDGKIYHADNIEDLKNATDEFWNDETKDITEKFRKNASRTVDDIIKNEIDYYKNRKKAEDNARERYADKQYDEYEEEDDVDDDVEPTEEPELPTTPEPVSEETEEERPTEPVEDEEEPKESSEDSLEDKDEEEDEPVDTEPEPEPSPIEPEPHPEPKTPKKVSGATEILEQVFEDLLNAIKDAAKLKYGLATGWHYFIKNAEGKLELHRRVHSIIPDRWDTVDEGINRAELQDQFYELLKDCKSFKELRNKIEELLDYCVELLGYNNEGHIQFQKDTWEFSLNLDAYQTFIEQDGYETQDNLNEIALAASHILSQISKASLISGNIFDTLARVWLNYDMSILELHDLTYDLLNDEKYSTYLGKRKVTLTYTYEYTNNNGETKTRSLLSEDAFKKIKSLMIEIKKYFDDKGWKLCTDAFTLHGKLLVEGKVINVAGETDCIVVDQDGNKHILDFKTYKFSLSNAYFELYREGTNPYNSFYDVGERNGNKFAFSTAAQYANQLAVYRMLAHQLNQPCISSMCLLLGINYLAINYIPSIIGDNIDSKGIPNTRSALLIPEKYEKDAIPTIPNIIRVDKSNLDSGIQEALDKLSKRINEYTDDEYKKLASWLNGEKAILKIDNKYLPFISINVKSLNRTTEKLRKDHEAGKLSIDSLKNHYNKVTEAEKELQNLIEELIEQDRLAKEYEKHYYVGENYENVNNLLNISLHELWKSYINLDQLDEDEIEESKLDILDNLAEVYRLLQISEFSGENELFENSKLVTNDINEINDFVVRRKWENDLRQAIENLPELNVDTEDNIESGINITGLIDSAESAGKYSVVKSKTKDGKKLVDQLHNADFINSSRFYVQKGDRSGLYNLVIVYKGEEYSPVRINFAHSENNGEFKWFDKSKVLHDQLDELFKKGEERVEIKRDNIKRSFGKFVNREMHSLSNEELQKLTGKTLDDIRYSSEDGTIALTRQTQINGKRAIVATVPGQSSDEVNRVYTYSGKNKDTNPISGGVVLLHSPNYDEINNSETNQDKKVVPINLIAPNFDSGTAELVADILLGNHSEIKDGSGGIGAILNSRFIQNGIKYPITNLDVIQLFISVGKHNQKGKKQHLHIDISEGIKKIKIVGLLSGDVNPTVRSFNLNNESQRKEFVDFLQDNVRILIFEYLLGAEKGNDFLKQFLNYDNSLGDTNVINSVLGIKEGDGELVFGNSKYTIKQSDINRSGAAWFIRNGLLQTTFEGLEHPLISIEEDNAIGVSEDPILIGEPVKAEDTVTETNYDDSGWGDYDDETGTVTIHYDKRIDIQDITSNINEDVARQHINDILGDVPLVFQDNVLYSLGSTVVVGQCRHDMILLSRQAPAGVEYHEAFHRILELLISEKDREKAYRKYRARFEKRNPGLTITDEQIAELAADEFWYYKENNPINGFKPSWNFIDMFKTLKNWYKFYKEIGSFTLYKLYRAAANGRFRNIRPSEDAVNRFNSFAKKGYLPYTIKRIDQPDIVMPHIANAREYDAVMQTFMYVATDPRTYAYVGQDFDITGKYLNSVHLNSDILINSPAVRNMLNDKGSISQESKYKLMDFIGILYNEIGVPLTYQDTLVDGRKVLKYKLLDNRCEYITDLVSRNLSNYQMEFTTQEDKERSNLSKNSKKDDFDNSQDNSNEDDFENGGAGMTGKEFEQVSHDVDPINRLSARLKFFLARVRDIETVSVVNEEGQIGYIQIPKLNEAGLFLNADVNEMYGYVLNRLHTVRSQKGLIDLLKSLSENDDIIKAVYNNFDKLMKKAYGEDYDKYSDYTKLKVIDENAAGVVAEFTKALAHSKNVPVVAIYDKKTRTTRVISEDYNYSVKHTRLSWTSAIRSGETKFIEVDKNGKFKLRKGGEQGLKSTTNWFVGLCQLCGGVSDNKKPIKFKISSGVLKANVNNDGPKIDRNSGATIIEINSEDINFTKKSHLEILKSDFVHRLNELGILVNLADIDYIVSNYYNGSFIEFIKSNSSHILGYFTTALKNLHNSKSDLNKVLNNIWSNTEENKHSKFIKILSEGQYERISNDRQQSYITIDGKKQYAMSEHNYLTDVLARLYELDGRLLKQLASDPFYTYSNDGTTTLGSRALKHVLNQASSTRLVFQPLPGSKTDVVGSRGIGYTSFSEVEDYMSKYALLAKNAIINSTTSDKTSYGATFGMDSFGINWLTDETETFTRSCHMLENGQVRFTDSVLNLFIQYAFCEYNSAKLELGRIQKGALKEEEMVANFHKSAKPIQDKHKKEHFVIQGARLSTFTGIYTTDAKGNEVYIDFNRVLDENGEYLDEKACLDTAEKYFFGENITNEERREIVNTILNKHLKNELDKLESLGLIEYESDIYTNKDLDFNKLCRILRFLSGDENIEYISDNDDKKYKNYNHNAVLIYVADMIAKAQMSHLEFLRLYAGNLAYYKWSYSKSGILTDTTSDFFKRIGGIMSTGEHNVMDISGQTREVKAAEVFDEEIVSNMADYFEKRAIEQEYYSALYDAYRRLDDEHKPDIKSINDYDDVESIKKDLRKTLQKLGDSEEDINHILKTIEGTVKSQAKKLREVDVNDGATYVSPAFCKRLLRSIGKWDKSISDAFDILEKGEYTYIDKNTNKPVTVKISNQDMRGEGAIAANNAYNKIYTTVIGAQKYTAFGQRKSHVKYTDDNGNVVEYTRNITYYDKTAYFPIFSCMATGNMKAILKKMQDANLDVLKITSAIKVGNTGAVKMDQSTFDTWNDPETGRQAFDNFKFNTYEQDFEDLRKQFNTDPKGKEFMNLGTQYVKVVMALLTAGQIFDAEGKEISPNEMRDLMMTAMNNITENGESKHNRRFYNEDGTLNVSSFLDVLSKQLKDRDVNDPILKQLVIGTRQVKDGDDVKIQQILKLPIAALSSGRWIESIIASIVNKDIVDIQTPGQAFYQRSAYGMEGIMNPRLLDESDLGFNDAEYVINHGMPLLEINEEGSTDCVLTIDFFDYIFEKIPKLKNLSFRAKERYLIRNSLISGWDYEELEHSVKIGDAFLVKDENGKDKIINIKDEKDLVDDSGNARIIKGKIWKNAKANIVGYRIPTQAVSSIHALRCVGVLPAIRDSIILPKEITAVTGSDFDIDKFFLSTKFYDVNPTLTPQIGDVYITSEKYTNEKNKKRTSYVPHVVEEGDVNIGKEIEGILLSDEDKLTVLSEIQKGTSVSEMQRMLRNMYSIKLSKNYENELLDYQLNLLKSTGNNIAKLHGSIDADTERLKQIRDELNKKEKEVRVFDATSLITNITAKMNFAIGKSGIGPFALNNNNHVLTMLYGVKFQHDDGSILDLLDLEDLSKGRDRHGRSILSWISGLINAHVDVAKDAYVKTLGINKYTYNLVNLLIRTGYGEETFWFTTQPIMQNIYDAYDKASGIYMQDEDISQYTRTNNAIAEAFRKYINEVLPSISTKSDNVEDNKELISEYFKSKGGINKLIKAVIKSNEGVKVLKDISTNDYDTDKTFEIKYNNEIIQLTLGEIQLIVGYTNFELQKYAKHLSDLVQYTKIDTKKQGKNIVEQQHYYQKFKNLRDNSPFENIEKMIDNSFIGKKTETAINAYMRLLSTQIYEATDGFNILMNQVLGALNIDIKDLTLDSRSSICKMIIAKLKSYYFFDPNNGYCARNSINPSALLSGSDSIFKQLLKIKQGVLNRDNKEFDSIRDNATGLCNNYLIEKLVCSDTVGESEIKDENLELVSTDYIQDQWQGSQFIMALNMNEDSIKQSDMQNAWEDLLNSGSPTLQKFADQLIVYAFMTSVEAGGRFDLFKFVPPSWMVGETDVSNTQDPNDSFAEFVRRQIESFNSDNSENDIVFTEDELQEMILNFRFDDNIVRTVSEKKLTSMQSWDGGTGIPLITVAVNAFEDNVFDQERYPGYFKVAPESNVYKTGLYKHNVYKLVGMTKISDSSSDITYPVYALVAPSGGTYNGHKIFSMGITDPINNISFSSRWNDIFKQIGSKENLRDFSDLVSWLLYGMQTDDKRVNQVIKSYKNAGIDIFVDTISGLKSEIDEESLRSISDIRNQRSNYLTGDLTLNLINQINDLKYEKLPNGRYKKVDEQDVYDSGAFNEEQIAAVRSMYGGEINVQFYKKSWEDGSWFNYAAEFFIKDKSAYGSFELVSDIDIVDGKAVINGQYSIHFKTYSAKVKSDNSKTGSSYAKRALTPNNKRALFNSVIAALPEGSTLHTTENISKGALNALLNINQFGSEKYGYLIESGDIKEYNVKGIDEKQSIPVWKKVKSEKVDDRPVSIRQSSESKSINKQSVLESLKNATESIDEALKGMHEVLSKVDIITEDDIRLHFDGPIIIVKSIYDAVNKAQTFAKNLKASEDTIEQCK